MLRKPDDTGVSKFTNSSIGLERAALWRVALNFVFEAGLLKNLSDGSTSTNEETDTFLIELRRNQNGCTRLHIAVPS
jgi:hypothetical protein